MTKRDATPQRRMRIGKDEDRQKVMDELMEQSHAIVFSNRLNRAVNPEHKNARIIER